MEAVRESAPGRFPATTSNIRLSAFISYSRKDIEFVDRLQTALDECGIDAVVDREDIEKGEDWWLRIQQLIRESDKIVFVLSRSSVTSEICQREVDFAQRLNKQIVPIVARDIGSQPVPDALARLNFIFFTADPGANVSGDFNQAMNQLVHVLETDINWIRENTRLGTLAARWEDHRQSKELLLRGAELTAAEAWLITQPKQAPVPTNAHRAFITASRRAATARQRLIIALSLAVAVIASGLSAVAFWQWGVATENERLAKANEQRAIAERNILAARQLGGQAKALLDQGIGAMQSRGVLLGVESMRRHPNADATDALQQAIALRGNIVFETEACGFCRVGYYSAFSPDSSRLAVAGRPARVLDVRTGDEVMVLGPGAGDKVIHSDAIAFDPTGRYIATAGSDHTIRIWSAENGQQVSRVSQDGEFGTPLTFDPAGRLLATVGLRGAVQVWRVPDLVQIKRFDKHGEGYFDTPSLSFSPDGTLVAQTVSDGGEGAAISSEVYLWSVRTGALDRVFKLDRRADFARFAPTGSVLAVGVAGTVRLLDAASGSEISRVGEEEAREMVSVGFNADGTVVGAVGWDAPARVWSVESGREVYRFEHERGIIGVGRIESVSISPDGGLVATHGGVLRLWRLNQIDSPANTMRWAAGDRRLLEYGTVAPLLPGDEGEARSSDGHVCLRWRNLTAMVYTCDSGTQIADLNTAGAIVRGALSDTGRYAALLDEAGRIAAFEIATARRVYDAVGSKDFVTLSERARLIAHATPSGRLVVVPLGEAATIRLSYDGNAAWAQFSPSGRRLLSSPDGTLIIVHELKTGAVLGRYAHDRPVSAVMWLEEPRYFASVSENDGTARIWDVDLDEVLLRWHLKTNLASARIGVSVDGRIFSFFGLGHGNEIAEAASFSRSALWRPADLIEAACDTVNRNLSEEEWARYFTPDVPYRESCVFE